MEGHTYVLLHRAVKSLNVHVSKALNKVSFVNLPEADKKQGKQQVFLQAVSEPPAAIQAKQQAFARAALQQLHCAAIAEFTVMLKMSRDRITIKVVDLFPSIFLLLNLSWLPTKVSWFVLRCAS
jgi:hypothetical protein